MDGDNTMTAFRASLLIALVWILSVAGTCSYSSSSCNHHHDGGCGKHHDRHATAPGDIGGAVRVLVTARPTPEILSLRTGIASLALLSGQADDITLLETPAGDPRSAFDLQQLGGPEGLAKHALVAVRAALPGGTFETLRIDFAGTELSWHDDSGWQHEATLAPSTIEVPLPRDGFVVQGREALLIVEIDVAASLPQEADRHAATPFAPRLTARIHREARGRKRRAEIPVVVAGTLATPNGEDAGNELALRITGCETGQIVKSHRDLHALDTTLGRRIVPEGRLGSDVSLEGTLDRSGRLEMRTLALGDTVRLRGTIGRFAARPDESPWIVPVRLDAGQMVGGTIWTRVDRDSIVVPGRDGKRRKKRHEPLLDLTEGASVEITVARTEDLPYRVTPAARVEIR